MGGEWWIHILDSTSPFDLEKYHSMLKKIKEEFAPKFQTLGADQGAAFWCDDAELPPADNIFARFTYKCDRHSHWGKDGHQPVWHLFWDPTVVPDELKHSDLHEKCGLGYFFDHSYKIQTMLEKAFPKHFEVEWDDYYNTRQPDYYCDESSSELEDFAACDKDECGYCGKCPY